MINHKKIPLKYILKGDYDEIEQKFLNNHKIYPEVKNIFLPELRNLLIKISDQINTNQKSQQSV